MRTLVTRSTALLAVAAGACWVCLADDQSTRAFDWNLELLDAPQAWEIYQRQGEGVVIGVITAGVAWQHPALITQYRGNPGGGVPVDHRFSWFDVEGSAAPFDLLDRGTGVIGHAVGDDGTGSPIGVAPRAVFIACRPYRAGALSTADLLTCLEWMTAPYPMGGDKFLERRRDLGADVVILDWDCTAGPNCDRDALELALRRLESLGIYAVTFAGHDGPSCSTIDRIPASFAAVHTVGHHNASRLLHPSSSRGPVSIDGSNRLKPDLIAPGVDLRSARAAGGYATSTSNALAAGHVAGLAALLSSIRPAADRNPQLMRCLLEQSASKASGVAPPNQCGGVSYTVQPNSIAGWGVPGAIDALTLPDPDHDQIGGGCDCAPLLASTYAVPQEVRFVEFVLGSKTRLRWESQALSAGSATAYDLLRGDLISLSQIGNIGFANCAIDSWSGNEFDEFSVPPAGRGYSFLVRATNSCGRSTWGFDSSGAERINTRCP
jgi:subtilisin family serine protease